MNKIMKLYVYQTLPTSPRKEKRKEKKPKLLLCILNQTISRASSGDSGNIADPRTAQLMHLYRQLKQIIQTSQMVSNITFPQCTIEKAHLSHCVLALCTLSPHTYTPCRLTSTAYDSGYSSIAFSKYSVKSSSNGVFSITGILNVS